LAGNGIALKNIFFKHIFTPY